MPEISSRSRILEKLKEFDERLDGAYSAIEILVRSKNTAEQLVASIGENQKEGDEARQHLLQIQEEWNRLKNMIMKTIKDADMARQEMVDGFDDLNTDFKHSFDDELNKLYRANIASRSEHNQFLEQSRIHADKTEQARQSVVDSISQAEQLLQVTGHELSVRIDEMLSRVQFKTEEQLASIEKEWQGKVSALQQTVGCELASFRETVQGNLATHKQNVDHNLTEFLAKQNILIQNLTQQIDGFQRSTQTLASEQQAMWQGIRTMEGRLSNISGKQNELEETMQNHILVIGTRLEQVINRLKGILMVKNSFKDM